MERPFQLVSEFKPMGDQPEAIRQLVEGIRRGEKHQVLLGATGTGKTFTMANVIAQVQKPTLVIAHNKTLAAQLCSEFKEFFPHNAVEYFVSYYDYYQPEAYVPQTDTYIEKDASINDEIDKLRHSATSALFERRDVIIVASVSCIYGLGDPREYRDLVVSLRVGMEKSRDEVLRRLVDIQYQRNDLNFTRGTFRVRGDVVEIFPASRTEQAVRVEFFGDEIERITEIDVLTGEVLAEREHVAIFPASHYVTSQATLQRALVSIEQELEERLAELRAQGKLLEAQRLEQRTRYDLEMLREMGYCPGIENYSRHLTGRAPSEPPYTLLDYFPDDYLIIIDESHVTIPQLRAMYNGDRSRKETLIEYGFRLPSAADNRPLKFEEFEQKVNQIIYVSATPGPYELEKAPYVVEQVIRPTGLVDPTIDVRPTKGQIDDLIGEIRQRVARNERVLITTLTKKMAEDLTDYLREVGIKVKYMHSEIKTIERMQLIRDLRLGVFDVLVGINLLREGLDIPEVSLVVILDADKEGFLRSETALIQTIGRAARNANGHVILYADRITERCGGPSPRRSGAARSRSPTTRPTASRRRRCGRPCATSSRPPTRRSGGRLPAGKRVRPHDEAGETGAHPAPGKGDEGGGAPARVRAGRRAPRPLVRAEGRSGRGNEAREAMSQEYIVVKGARVHNLKNIDVTIPRNKLVVITGLSGSGKSSLAFDTIYAEGQRRYVESLSAYARQFLGLMEKPDVDAIEGLSPAISIDQKTTSRNPRSTVGTVTEIYDYLRLLYARIGKAHCPVHASRFPPRPSSRWSTACWPTPSGRGCRSSPPSCAGARASMPGCSRRCASRGLCACASTARCATWASRSSWRRTRSTPSRWSSTASSSRTASGRAWPIPSRRPSSWPRDRSSSTLSGRRSSSSARTWPVRSAGSVWVSWSRASFPLTAPTAPVRPATAWG